MDIEHLYNLTPEQYEAFKELKKRIHNDFDPKVADDCRIYRFLKARDFNVKNAEQMLRENIHWRQRQNIDSLLENYEVPEVLKKHCATYIPGYDLEGHPVLVLDMALMDIKGLSKCFSKEAMVKHITYTLQSAENFMKENSTKLGKNIDKWVVIPNFEDFSIFSATNKQFIDFMIALIKLYERNYPERLHKCLVINVSHAFTVIFSICKPFFTPVTLEKMTFYNSNTAKEVLEQNIGKDVLSSFITGYEYDAPTIYQPLTPIARGGKVPEQYYFKNSTKSLKFQNNVTKCTLKSNKMLKVPQEISIPGSLLNWEFETENFDIGFGLTYEDKEKNIEKILIPIQKINTENFCEIGQLICKEIGLYTFIFDNTFSWIRQKQLFYKISITTPEDCSSSPLQTTVAKSTVKDSL